MIDERFVLVGVVINFIGSLSYVIDTLKGKTRPNRVSWFMWALAPLIAFSAELKQGVGIQSLMTFTVGFSPLLVFVASFINKKSVWKIQKFDLFCGALSVVGLIFWYVTKVGNVAIMFSILSDGLAAVPTIVKSFRYPETENDLLYSLAAVNATITLLTIKNWSFAHYAFPVYILLIDIVLFVLIRFKLGKRR